MSIQMPAANLESALAICPYRSMILPGAWPAHLAKPDVECVIQLDWNCLETISMELLTEKVDEAAANGHAVLLIAENREVRDKVKEVLMTKLEARKDQRQKHAIELLMGELK